MDDRLEENKRRVLAFYDLMFNQCRPAEAVERYVGASYTQHTPMVANQKSGRSKRERPSSSGPPEGRRAARVVRFAVGGSDPLPPPWQPAGGGRSGTSGVSRGGKGPPLPRSRAVMSDS
jgi:hypothetical protein